MEAGGAPLPGDREGPLVQIEVARAIAQEMREGFPESYPDAQ